MLATPVKVTTYLDQYARNVVASNSIVRLGMEQDNPSSALLNTTVWARSLRQGPGLQSEVKRLPSAKVYIVYSRKT